MNQILTYIQVRMSKVHPCSRVQLALKEVIEMEVSLERERVKQEMKVAAEEYERAQREREAEEAELEQKHMERLQLIAVRVLQGRVRTFIARKALRQRAYLRYKKHFDPATGCYYYEDKRTGQTFWDKPRSLGSYDVECDNAWVAMRDTVRVSDDCILDSTLSFPFVCCSRGGEFYAPLILLSNFLSTVCMFVCGMRTPGVQEGEVYYYHPRSWRMQWNIPHKTLMCVNCHDLFCAAYLYIDNSPYCESCLSQRVNELLQSISPSKILYAPVNGGFEGSLETNFKKLKKEPWPTASVQQMQASALLKFDSSGSLLTPSESSVSL